MKKKKWKLYICGLFAFIMLLFGSRMQNLSEDEEMERGYPAQADTAEKAASVEKADDLDEADAEEKADAVIPQEGSQYDELFEQGMERSAQSSVSLPSLGQQEPEEAGDEDAPSVEVPEYSNVLTSSGTVSLGIRIPIRDERIMARGEDLYEAEALVPYEEEEPETEKKRESRVNLEVPCVLQEPELPTGCEVTSLTMVLQWMGYSIDKLTLAREYLPQKGLTGIDSPYDFFIGDPEREYAYGCYPPVIVHTANAYFHAINEFRTHGVNYTGCTLNELLDYIDEYHMPVIVWVTQNLEEPYEEDVWFIDGEQISWTSPNHCVVLYGYNDKTSELFVADPLVGNVIYNKHLFEMRYEAMGEKAVIIRLQKSGLEE